MCARYAVKSRSCMHRQGEGIKPWRNRIWRPLSAIEWAVVNIWNVVRAVLNADVKSSMQRCYCIQRRRSRDVRSIPLASTSITHCLSNSDLQHFSLLNSLQ